MTRYIKLFETETNRQTYERSVNYQEPYSSGVIETQSAYYEVSKECVRLNYITATSGRIYLGITPKTANIDCEMKFKHTTTTKQQRFIGGPCTNSNYNSYDVYVNGSSYYAYSFGTKYRWVSTGKGLNSSQLLLQIDLSTHYLGSRQIKISTVSGTSIYSAALTSIDNTSYANDAGKSELYIDYKTLYYLKLWEGGVLVRDFVPVRLYDTIGLLDLVTNQFRVPASGTWTGA